MGKKKQVHANQSFSQMVGKANQEALKPYIDAAVSQEVSNLGNQIAQKFFQNLANIQMRIMALEQLLTTKLGLSQNEINDMVLDMEDEATGHVKVSRPAQKGDLIRVTVSTRNSSEPTYMREVKKEINSLLSTPYALTKTCEEALVGRTVGETVEVDLEGKVMVKMVINRISAYPQQTTESTNESTNA